MDIITLPKCFTGSARRYRKSYKIIPGSLPVQDSQDRFRCGTAGTNSVLGTCDSNLVTIDYDRNHAETGEQRGSVGKVFHITNPNPPKGRKLFNMSADVIGIEGISFVEKLETLQSDPPTNPVLRRYEQKIFRRFQYACTSSKSLVSTMRTSEKSWEPITNRLAESTKI